MIRSSISRLAAIAFVVIAAAGGPGLAQTPPYGYIGLYADEARSSNSVLFSGSETRFTMYVFCGPTDRGISAAEFSIAYPENVVPAGVTTNPLITVSLGDIDSGISVAFADCQNDWVWTHRQRLYLTDPNASRIEIEKNAATGEYQIVTCSPGYMLEPVFISSLLCLNAVCPQDTVPPLLQGASIIESAVVAVSFSEQILKRFAEDPASYEIAEFNDTTITLPIAGAVLSSDGASAELYTSQPFATDGRKYVVHAKGVYDAWGNAVPSSSTCMFIPTDIEPPRLVSASASVDTLVTVVFNEAVSPATATNPNNYRITRDGEYIYHAYRATLAAENRVVLSMRGLNRLPTLITFTLTVTNVTDLAGNVISPSHDSAHFMILDTQPPYLSAIQVLGQTLLSVMFDEPVLRTPAETPGNYEIYRKSDTLMAEPIPLTGAARQSDTRYVRLTLGADLVLETPYVLRVHDIEDLNGNRMPSPSIMEFLWPHTAPPVPLSALPLNRSLIKIQFDERLDETTAETASNYEVYETSNTSITIAVTGAEIDTSGTAVRLSLGAPIKYDVAYTIRISRVKDLRGNAISAVAITTIYPDTFPPVLTGLTPSSEELIELAFNEKLSGTPAGNKSNYILFETDHPSNLLGISSATLAGDGLRVQLALSSDLVAGRSYTISMSNLTDLKGNVIAPGTSLVFIFMDIVPPRLLSAHADASTSVFTRFSEKLDEVTAENAGNYLIFEALNPAVTIPIAGASLLGDSSNVLLSLGSALTGGVAYSLEAAGITDHAGNPVPAGSVVLITGLDSTPPHLSTAEAVSLLRVRITFDEPVTAATAGAAANYLIIPAANPGSAIVPASVQLLNSMTVELRLGTILVSAAAYKVRVSNVADLLGNVIAPGSEKSFVCPTIIPTGSGSIGLYVDANHSSFEVWGDSWTPFTTYVWYLAGSAGMTAAEFSIKCPDNVSLGSYAFNPLIPVSLGDPLHDLSVAFTECQSEWVWILAGECRLLDRNESEIVVGDNPILANCSEGFPLESATVISRIFCNPIYVGTLLRESAASYRGGAVEVTWRLSRMDEGVRFMVLRKEEGASAYGTPSDDVEANGLSFTYRDKNAEPGTTYRYRVDYVNASGSHVLFETDPVAVPTLPLTLNQNWPNPFNPSTTISYYLPDAVRVRLEIFDVAGHRIACLANGSEERGNHSAVWNGAGESGRPAAAGIYICRLTAGRETLSRKIVLVR